MRPKRTCILIFLLSCVQISGPEALSSVGHIAIRIGADTYPNLVYVIGENKISIGVDECYAHFSHKAAVAAAGSFIHVSKFTNDCLRLNMLQTGKQHCKFDWKTSKKDEQD